MIEHVRNALTGLADVSFHRGLDPLLLVQFELEHGFALPPAHIEVLRGSNGIEAYAGYIRLFGVYSTESLDSVAWNRPEYWKHAWGTKCSLYWCFGETAWGDQYAYRLDSLRAGSDPAVYLLDGISMGSELIATSIQAFLEEEFLRVATLPYDPMMIAARKKFGSLEPATHLVYMPPLPLGGTEDVDHLEKMPAWVAMILNGDIDRQLEEADSEQVLKGLEPYQDENGRARVRLLWE